MDGKESAIRSRKRAVSGCHAACQALSLRKAVEQIGASLVPRADKSYIYLMDRASFFSPQAGRLIDAPLRMRAQFAIGDVVRHRLHDFRGVVFDIDPVFANSEEWYEAIPVDVRPAREQPFYHLLAENGESSYVAYVSQQNLIDDGDSGPVDHPSLEQLFDSFEEGHYQLRQGLKH